MHKFSPSFSKELIKWFANNRRDMPWRKKPSLYRVWISEIMLQQTRVEQATPHFNRWIKIFPSLKSLINANEQEVISQLKLLKTNIMVDFPGIQYLLNHYLELVLILKQLSVQSH